MAILPSILVWLSLTTASQPAAGGGSGLVPSSSEDMTDLSLLARLRDPSVRPSAIDRADSTHAAKRSATSELTETSEFAVDGIARSTHRFVMPAGPRTIRHLEIEPAPGMHDAWRNARLKLQWEREGHAPGVDLPLGFAFGRLPGVPPFRTLLLGTDGPAWANRFPMPYRREAFLQIDSETAIRGTIRVRTLRGVAPDAGYFRAAYREGVAPSFEFNGRGHYAGAMIAARFPAEGSEASGPVRLVIPGVGTELRIAGEPGPTAHRDASPTQGRFLGRTDSGSRQAVAYRWRAVDPIPFIRPIRATIESDAGHRPTDIVPVALAVFWYSDRPGPESDPAGP